METFMDVFKKALADAPAPGSWGDRLAKASADMQREEAVRKAQPRDKLGRWSSANSTLAHSKANFPRAPGSPSKGKYRSAFGGVSRKTK